MDFGHLPGSDPVSNSANRCNGKESSNILSEVGHIAVLAPIQNHSEEVQLKIGSNTFSSQLKWSLLIMPIGTDSINRP
jgi:hypothetical protein